MNIHNLSKSKYTAEELEVIALIRKLKDLRHQYDGTDAVNSVRVLGKSKRYFDKHFADSSYWLRSVDSELSSPLQSMGKSQIEMYARVLKNNYGRILHELTHAGDSYVQTRGDLHRVRISELFYCTNPLSFSPICKMT